MLFAKGFWTVKPKGDDGIVRSPLKVLSNRRDHAFNSKPVYTTKNVISAAFNKEINFGIRELCSSRIAEF